MENQELIKFVEWLMESNEAPDGASFEETVSWINDLSKSDSGKEMLTQLTNTYKNKNDMKLFEKGGKLNYLLCLKSGGKGPDCGCNKQIAKAGDGIKGIPEKYGFRDVNGTTYTTSSIGTSPLGTSETITSPDGKTIWNRMISPTVNPAGPNYETLDSLYTKNGVPVTDAHLIEAVKKKMDGLKSDFMDSRYYSGYSDRMKQNGTFQEGGRIFDQIKKLNK